MEWIIVGLIGLFLLSKAGNTTAQSASPIQNATGGSLSSTLGNTAAPPSYFNSGNPQYNATPNVPAMSPPAVPIESRITAPAAPQSPTQVSNMQRAGTVANPSAPVVRQPVPIRTRVVGPEVSSAFWTKAPIRINRVA